jgi:transaldolase
VAASLKSPQELLEARLAGVPILSAPLQVLAQLPNNEFSDAALEEFRNKGIGLLDHHGKEFE